MKWIGQHIYDLVARFRNDVYLEDISSGTIASGGNLGLDSNNKIVKQDDAGITDLHGAGVDGAANQLLTDDGDGTITSEATLQFGVEANVLDIGANDDSTASLRRLAHTDGDGGNLNVRAGNATSGQTNMDGGALGLYGGRSTGSGSGGAIYFYTAAQGSSGTSVNPFSSAMGIFHDNSVTFYGNITLEGATPDSYETTLSVVDPTQDATITIPNQTGTLLTTGTNTGGHVEIQNASDSDAAALLIDNDDVDQIALDIDAANTTANIIDINAQALTTGKAVFIDADSLTTALIAADIDDILTSSTSKGGILIDYDKASGANLPNEITNQYVGFNSLITDNASGNHAGSTQNLIGFNSDIEISLTTGNIYQTGYKSIMRSTLASYTLPTSTQSFYSLNTYGEDFRAVSAENVADFFTINTGTNGATTLTTVDGSGHNLANFEIATAGNITLDAAGDIALECGGGDLTCDADTVTFESTNADDPVVTLKNKTDDDQGVRLDFIKERVDSSIQAGEDGDNVGEISFKSYNDGTPAEITYAKITAEIDDASTGSESGKISHYVASHDAELQRGLLLISGDAEDEVDVTIANGAASLTTTEGNLRVGGAATNNNWISLYAQDGGDTNGAGITFYETGTYSVSAPQYGGKIVYNEDDDEFNIGSMQNNVFLRQISIDRGNPNTRIAQNLYIERGDGNRPNLYISNKDTTITDTQDLGRIAARNDDDGGVTSSINWVATEDHASGANGGTKIEIKTTAKGTSAEHTAMAIGGNTSISVYHDYDTITFENQLSDNEGGGEILRYGSAQEGSIGQLHFLHTDGTWDEALATGVATGASQLLGVALGTDPGDHGMLLDGYCKVASGNIEGTSAIGAPVYVSDTTGKFDFAAPADNNEFVRIVGYCIDIDSSDILLRFKPDNTWVELDV